jgi:hypothetical protein
MVLESAGAVVPSRRMHTDPFTGTQHPISATSLSPRSFATAIRADIGESEAYKQALGRGEIGLQRPMGANVAGADFITAILDANGSMEIVVTDVKTSEIGKFPVPKTHIPGVWQAEVAEAIAPGRLNLNDRNLEAQIRSAYQAGRVRLRQLHANYSPSGQGIITGW